MKNGSQHSMPVEAERSGPVVMLSMPGVDPLVGVTIAQRYALIEKIGEGGMGVVYRGEEAATHEPVAVKLLLPELGRVGEVAQRFEREAQAVGRLEHGHIVRVVDVGKMDSGGLYLVMELLEGESLADLLKARGRLPPARAVRVMRQILSALDHAHSEGVIHRDLKPENVMLLRGQDDFVKLLDFGIAKIRDESSESEMIKLTQAGLTLGTPDYMSPEQAAGWDVDARADVYACGVLLFEMLTGRKPFVATNAVNLMVMHTTQPAPSPRAVAPDAGIPTSLDAAVLRSLEKDRDQRFPSAGAFLGALDHQEGCAAVPKASTPLSRAWRSCAFARQRAWLNFWCSPRIMSARVRARLWWVTRPAASRRAIPIAALALWVFGISAVLFIRHRVHAQANPPPQPGAALPTERGEEDLVAGYLRQLANGSSCEQRRDAIIHLRDAGDPRALKALRKARAPKGFARMHACMTRDEIDEAIRTIERR